MPVTPALPIPGADNGTWGAELNAAIQAVADHSNAQETAVGGKAASVHSHTEGDVTGLAGDLAGKAPLVHSHAESDVTGLVSDLAGKVPTSRQVTAGTGLTGGGALTSDRSLAVLYGSTSGTACQGNDTRLGDPGYDVVVAAGQSNMSGRAVSDTRYDVSHSRVWTYDTAGSYPGVITQAAVPLGHADRLILGNTLGPDLAFARLYADSLPASRRVLLVPVAFGGSGFSVAGAWDPSAPGGLYVQAIRRANAAVAAAGEGARVAAFLWLQGEADIGMSSAAYQAKLDALIAGFRSSITTATTSTPFVVGQLLPEFVAANGSGAAGVDGVLSGTPARVAYTAYASVGTGYNSGDNLHYNAAGQRLMGAAMREALTLAQTNDLTSKVPPKVQGLKATPGAGQVALAWDPTPATPAVSDYVVESRPSGGTWTTFTDGVSTGTTATVTGLTNGSSYEFRVSAVNSSGTGPTSSTVSSTPSTALTLISDSFTRADNASNPGSVETGGQAWTSFAGTWGINSNRLVSATMTEAFCVIDAGVASCTVQGTVVSNAQEGLDLAFWVTDASNGYLVYSGGGSYSVSMKSAGSYTSIATSAVTPVAGDVIKVVLVGNSFTVFRNGTQIMTGSKSTAAPGTKHGWRRGAGAGTSGVPYYADDFTVTVP